MILANKLSEVSSVSFGVDILVTNSMEENGYKELLPFISEGKTIAFIGSSGVGKSTLINRLLGQEYLKQTGFAMMTKADTPLPAENYSFSLRVVW